MKLSPSDTKVCDEAFGSFCSELDEFMAGRLPNRYVYGNDIITVYARKGSHLIQGAVIKCLDIASIIISSEYQGYGIGTKVINHMHNINPFRCTYVESILNDRLYDRLIRQGWKEATVNIDRNLFLMTPLPVVSSLQSEDSIDH